MFTATATAVSCPKCGSAMVERSGRFGAFYGCTKFARTGCKGNRPMGAKPVAPASAARAADGIHAPGFLDMFIGAIKGSAEQCDIWRAIESTDSHIIVQALAGCGKSFTAAHAIKRLVNINPSVRIHYACFNKSIKMDFLPKASVTIGGETVALANVNNMNSVGHSLLSAHYRARGENFRLDTMKMKKIADMLAPDVDDRDTIIADIAKYASLLKSHNMAPTDANLSYLADRFNLALRETYPNMLIEALRMNDRFMAGAALAVDFDDQLYMPIVKNMKFPAYDYVFVDEAQDLNSIQHAMMLRYANDGARIIVIGDENQAIYGFRGADSDSINNLACELRKTNRDVLTLGLTETRRCPINVVAYVNSLFPEIPLRALPDAPIGSVEDIAGADLINALAPHDMVLSRVNAPLVSVAFKLIRANKPVYIQGRNIGETIIGFINGLNAKSIPHMLEKVESHRDREIEKLHKIASKRGGEVCAHAIDAINDKCDVISEIASGVKERNGRAGIKDVIACIETLFADADDKGKPANAIVLSSVHKAKGMESDNVYILTPELFPHPAAKAEWERRQERNCHYVALTRAKNKLIMVN